ncbi:hypothetical protein BN59_02050 [Legionella massiliensis]|uniref:Uncharacterized protein n=1 Tax=Legionella massiliensis TaxID=1034943 RepID=A0A078KTE7_9GAMM|nr:hypothetical protein [Legionella massiliensis]CDZ77760.1 hypothetical protein BN59_02050 [Legionella massiliensis]CEE13498.1 hypothetical protein BN1094_02050 [Legionella massiliensis]
MIFVIDCPNEQSLETKLKIDFIKQLEHPSESYLLNTLVASLDAKFDLIKVVFVDDANQVSNPELGIIALPLNLPLDETLYYLINALCLFDNQANLDYANFNSAGAYAEAILHWQYTATTRCVEICMDYLQSNKTELESDSPVDVLQAMLNLSFEDYKLQMQAARLSYESAWQETQEANDELNATGELIKELEASHLNTLRKLDALSEQALENKLRIEQLRQEIEPYVASLTPSTYLFAQQRDASCMLMPFINLAQMRSQKKRDGGLKLFDRSWRSKEEWFSDTFLALKAWYEAMGRLSFPSDFEEHAFADYQNTLLSCGLLQENISELKTLDGSPYIDPNNLTSLKTLFYTPYTTSLGYKFVMLTKNLPLYSQNGRFYLFNPVNNHYLLVQGNRGEVLQVKDINIPEPLRVYYGLEPEMPLFPCRPAFGFEVSYRTSYFDKKEVLIENQDVGYFYSAGLYQLMLLGLQLDRDNQVIVEGHPLFSVYQNFKREMASSPVNPWNSEHFKKENLFEYHLAEILQERPDLKAGIQGCISSYTVWPYYSQFNELEGGADYEKYLPGENQMLAYAISQNLKSLWAMSLAAEKFAVALELNSLPETVLQQLDLGAIIEEIRSEAFKDVDGRCFISYWIELRGLLEQRVGANAELVSFDGHGSIKSFSPKIVSYQRQNGLADEELYTLLGYTEIDSFYNEGKQPFYQRTAAEEQQLNLAAQKIQEHWRFYRAQRDREQPASSSSQITFVPSKTEVPRFAP